MRCGRVYSWDKARKSGLEVGGWCREMAWVRGGNLAAGGASTAQHRARGARAAWAAWSGRAVVARAAQWPVISVSADICRRGVYSGVLCSTPVHTQTPASKQQAAPSLRVSLSGAQLCVSHLEWAQLNQVNTDSRVRPVSEQCHHSPGTRSERSQESRHEGPSHGDGQEEERHPGGHRVISDKRMTSRWHPLSEPDLAASPDFNLGYYDPISRQHQPWGR